MLSARPSSISRSLMRWISFTTAKAIKQEKSHTPTPTGIRKLPTISAQTWRGLIIKFSLRTIHFLMIGDRPTSFAQSSVPISHARSSTILMASCSCPSPPWAHSLPCSPNWFRGALMDVSLDGLVAFASKDFITLFCSHRRVYAAHLSGHTDRVTAVAFLHNGRCCAHARQALSSPQLLPVESTTSDTSAQLLDGDLGNSLDKANSSATLSISSATRTETNVVNTESNSVVQAGVRSMVCHEEAMVLCSGASDKKVIMWDCSNYHKLAYHSEHSAEVTAIATTCIHNTNADGIDTSAPRSASEVYQPSDASVQTETGDQLSTHIASSAESPQHRQVVISSDSDGFLVRWEVRNVLGGKAGLEQSTTKMRVIAEKGKGHGIVCVSICPNNPRLIAVG
jgi:WD40 repeat protein